LLKTRAPYYGCRTNSGNLHCRVFQGLSDLSCYKSYGPVGITHAL